MNIASIEPIVRALLYEGYVLYPYRADSLKNRHRWTLGGLVPRAYGEAHGEAWFLQAECMLRSDVAAMLTVCVRFLHPMESKGATSSWQEAAEESVAVQSLNLEEMVANSRRVPFSIPGSRSTDSQRERVQRAIAGTIELSAFGIGDHLYRLNIRVVNDTPLDDPRRMNRDEAMLYSLASAHVVIGVEKGEFISLTDLPDDLKKLADDCQNIGVWPILVGDLANRDTVLASPIILSDFPSVAPESPTDFFDGTEVDEMLALRILTLTDAEKREMADLDPRTGALLERVEGLSEARLARLHGAIRTPRPGDRVRLRPRGGADAFDILLVGKLATVATVEADFEGNSYVTVTVDEDPGRDLGNTAMPGHRFFFRPAEVELLTGDES